MKYIIGILLLVHGLIHFMGFAKAFSIAEISQLSQSISKNMGMLFLFAGLFFIASFLLFIFKSDLWIVVAILGGVLSQILIVIYWQDAKFGTLANIIILLAALMALSTRNFKKTYMMDVSKVIEVSGVSNTMITEDDIKNLPEPVQKYLRYTGVLGKPGIFNMKLSFKGEMRSKKNDWFSFTSQQINTFNEPARLFFMDAKVKGLPTSGYHFYRNDTASMRIKLLSLIPVASNNTPELFPTETVTYFNDLCLFAPAALIDERIEWEIIDATSVRAYFKNQGVTISAVLHFNDIGQLVNFVSDDRYDIDDMEKYRFSTPASNYKNYHGYNLPSYGEAIWHYPDGEFVYGRFWVQNIEYNIPIKKGK